MIFIQIEQDGDVHRLVIPKVNRQDSGRFTVQAYNSAGSKTTSAMVIVTSGLQSPSPGEQLLLSS